MKFLKKKRFIIPVAVAVALMAGGAAYGYFTAVGSGTGSAPVGKSAPLVISQVGAGYDSLVPGGGYTEDQCFGCQGITEFGNDITLANSGEWQQLVNVVVAFRNWGGAITDLPITLTINNTIAAPFSVTQDFSFAPAANPSSTPSVTNVTFDLSSYGLFVQREFVYGIAFDSSGDAGGLNVALSSSALNLAVGTDTHPGTVWLDTSYGFPLSDFPACTMGATGVWESVTTNCGLSNESGAYGTDAQVAAGSADIPAVEFNVVGGSLGPRTRAEPRRPSTTWSPTRVRPPSTSTK